MNKRGTSLLSALAVAAGIWFSFGGCASAPAPVERAPADVIPAAVTTSNSFVDRLHYGIDARLKAGLGFGYFAAVRETKKTTTFAAGRKSLEPVHPLGTRDLLEVGSVTKLFTGILLHVAEVENRLTVDQKLEELFPKLRGLDTGSITLRDLGTHTSGLPSWPEGVKERDPKNPWRDLTKDEVLGALAKFKRPAPPAGETKRPHVYSNWGFITLGLVLEQVYRKPFPAILSTHLLNPLGMTASGIDLSTKGRRGKTMPRVSPGYHLNTDSSPAWDFASFAAAAGGLESNAVDMGKFLEALENPPRGHLGEGMRATFISGIGWDSPPGNQRPLWKNGMTGAYSAFLAYYPETSHGLFIAVNADVAPDALADFAMSLKPTDELLARATGPRIAGEEELARLKGKYRNPKPGQDPSLPLRTLEIYESVGKLVARYDFGFVTSGALLATHGNAETWNVIDGSVNLDVLKLTSGGARATVTTSSGRQAIFELEKLPADVQKFPALEK